MWIILFAIVCEIIIGSYLTCWLYHQNTWHGIMMGLFTVAVVLATWTTFGG